MCLGVIDKVVMLDKDLKCKKLIAIDRSGGMLCVSHPYKFKVGSNIDKNKDMIEMFAWGDHPPKYKTGFHCFYRISESRIREAWGVHDDSYLNLVTVIIPKGQKVTIGRQDGLTVIVARKIIIPKLPKKEVVSNG